MDGKIFDIQRFSIYDGGGIRTNVFFKGCNLRCLWCHNPESQNMKNELLFRKDKCIGCGKCGEICSNTFTEKCTACGKCVSVCPRNAREISGRTVSADEVVRTVMRDKEFYLTSGGGVTLSGGEPLLQPEFAAEILEKCKAEGIGTAIETAGNVPWSVFERVLPYLDIILFDIKCLDEEKHKKYTGVSNSLILENAEKLKKTGKRLIFRTPVIPGVNDGEVKEIGKFCGGNEYEILAYHVTGCGKYNALGRKYQLDIEPPCREFMEKLAAESGAEYSFTGI